MKDGIRSLLWFDGVMHSAIYQLKYHNLRALAVPLAGLLNDYLNASHVLRDVLLLVPLYPKSLRERGYNQSSLLAQEVGKIASLPVVNNCLSRQRHAPTQARTPNVG